MGSDGSHGPRPFTQRKASTVFLRIPVGDWVPVTRGVKTEFRASSHAVTQALNLEPPTPVVAYRVRRSSDPDQTHDTKLMVLTDTWQEPIGSISPESLAREGFSEFAQFRRYWMGRTRRRFRPMTMVRVFVVRQFEEEDWMKFAELLMERLYGAFSEA